MNIFNVQSLISKGRVAKLTDIDPTKAYVQVGVYQPGNRAIGSGNANTFKECAIPLSEIGGGALPTGSGLYAQTADSTPVTNTTVETSLLDGGVGSLTVPANGFQVGDSFQANLSGHINSKNNDKLRIRIKTAAGVLLADTGDVTMPSCTNQHWDLKINFTVRTLGVAGVASIASTAMFTYTKDASNAFEGENISIINNTTFDTTVNNTLEVTAQWNAAATVNSIYTELFTLFKTY